MNSNINLYNFNHKTQHNLHLAKKYCIIINHKQSEDHEKVLIGHLPVIVDLIVCMGKGCIGIYP